jgi:putative phosphoesterase
MKIGIISDTHDNLNAIDRSIEILNRYKVDLVIHAGDVISPFAARRFKELNSPLKIVFSNNDGERTGLKKAFKEQGVEIDDFLELDIGGKRFAIYHGTIEGVQKSLVENEKYDVVIGGHTHRHEVKSHEGTIFINPGEMCGYLTQKRSLCVLILRLWSRKSSSFSNRWEQL